MKKCIWLLVSILFLFLFSFTAFAGEWKQEPDGRWWYLNDDGTYPFNCWQQIDGKYYYFDANGYLVVNSITPDGYLVGADGAWIQNTGTGSYSNNSSYNTADTNRYSSTNTEAYTARSSFSSEQSGTYYWTPSGKSYHTTRNCRSLSRSKTILSGSLSEAKSNGKKDPCNNCVR